MPGVCGEQAVCAGFPLWRPPSAFLLLGPGWRVRGSGAHSQLASFYQAPCAGTLPLEAGQPRPVCFRMWRRALGQGLPLPDLVGCMSGHSATTAHLPGLSPLSPACTAVTTGSSLGNLSRARFPGRRQEGGRLLRRTGFPSTSSSRPTGKGLVLSLGGNGG